MAQVVLEWRTTHLGTAVRADFPLLKHSESEEVQHVINDAVHGRHVLQRVVLPCRYLSGQLISLRTCPRNPGVALEPFCRDRSLSLTVHQVPTPTPHDGVHTQAQDIAI